MIRKILVFVLKISSLVTTLVRIQKGLFWNIDLLCYISTYINDY